MSIIDLLEIHNTILAVNDAGWIIMWDLSEIQRVNGAYIFKDNISILQSKGAIRIDPTALRGIRRYQNTLVMFNQQTIYVATFEQIIQGIREERMKNLITINISTFFEKKELINCLQVSGSDVETLLIGTNKGNLYSLDFKQNLVIGTFSLGKDTKQGSNQLTNFAIITKQIYEINSILLYGQREYALIGTSNGKAYSIRIQNLQKAFELTQKSKQTFQPIQKIVSSKEKEKIYFLHENYITQWSIKLGACLSYIEYSHPNDIFVKGNRIIIVGSHSKIIWYDTTQKEHKLSMRSARTIKELGVDHIAVGGSDGIIDILIGGMRLMTLFHREK